jgi:TolB-like protein/AraC-like DNA-binding protein
MDDIFLNNIRQSILKHIKEEKFSINQLASEVGLSRSQLLRKIKSLTGKSANHLIRKIRLEEAAKLIKNSDYTASEISYLVGFSSPSYFSKCFLDRFGFTPGEFKNQGGDIINSITNLEVTQKVHQKKLSQLFYTIPVIIIAVVGYFLYSNSINQLKETKLQSASIAILPFLNLSDNEDQEYFVDGITEAITLELSKFDALRVISRTSSMSYKGGVKLSSDIAHELNVDYLLEGSVLFGGDSIKVIVQLIKPFPEEKHIWQESYHQKYENILQLVSSVSNQISKEINAKVSPFDIVPNIYKVDTESYTYYLKGRHLWNQQSDKTMISCIENLQKSIKLDSSFAPAHVTLAEAYITLNKFINNNEEKPLNREKSRNAIKKALELDNNLAAAYITKGNILGKCDWNWKEMKNLVEKGLKLDPNNAYGHKLLSDYYLLNNNFDMAIKEALVAEKLDPMNPFIGTWVGIIYSMANDYEQSIKQYHKVLEIFPNYGSALSELGFVHYLNGQINDSKNSFIKLQEIRGNYEMVKAYKEEPMENVFRFWLSGVKAEEPKYCSYPILTAQVHMLIDEKEEALEYLEIAYKYRFEYLPTMLFRPEFKNLHIEPRFKRLVNKTGVTMNTNFLMKPFDTNFKD